MKLAIEPVIHTPVGFLRLFVELVVSDIFTVFFSSGKPCVLRAASIVGKKQEKQRKAFSAMTIIV